MSGLKNRRKRKTGHRNGFWILISLQYQTPQGSNLLMDYFLLRLFSSKSISSQSRDVISCPLLTSDLIIPPDLLPFRDYEFPVKNQKYHPLCICFRITNLM